MATPLLVRPGSVLVVEGSADLQVLLADALGRAGLDVRTVGSGAGCQAEVARRPPDVVLLDVGLPDVDGIELCRRLREQTAAWVLVLSARTEEVDLLLALAAGADGYMTKPLSTRELVARVQAFLRRPHPTVTGPAAPPAVVRLADLEVDREAREVRVGGAWVPLTRTEFELLDALASRPGTVLQRRTLLREVWDSDWEGSLRLVEAHMSNLRRKLQAAGLRQTEIRTVRGVGYRLVG